LAALAFATAGLVVAMPAAHAEVIALDGPATFACDQLYGSTGNGSVYAMAYDPTGQAETTLTRVYGTTAHPITSMALGQAPASRGGDGNLHGYHWGYNNSNSAGISVLDVTSGASSGTTFTVPRPGTSPYTWAGGEVNQATGEIYFSAGDGAQITTNYEIMIYDPISPSHPTRMSGRLIPDTPADTLTGTADTRIGSDMAIDAEGNIYVLAGASTKRLIKVVPGATGEWRYSRATDLHWSLGNSLTTANIYGMAFFDGALVVLSEGNGLHAIDGTSGEITEIIGSVPDSRLDGSAARDLASCQMPPIVRGSVYNDANGDGSIAASESGIAGIAVQVYEATGGRSGGMATNARGEYTLMLPDVDEDYYVRIAQPQIGGINAAQTWASATSSQSGTVVAACAAGGAASPERVTPGPCAGNRADNIDPSTIAAGQVTSQAAFWSRAHLTTRERILDADFAFSTMSSWGDAPESLDSLADDDGPNHVAPPATNRVWLGETVSTQADGEPRTGADAHASDDGAVIVLAGGHEVPLADAIVVPSGSYPIRAAVSGSAAATANVRVWEARLSGTGRDASSWTSTPIITGQGGTTGTVSGTWTLQNTQTSSSATTSNAYLRVRASTTANLGRVNTSSSPPRVGTSAANTTPWFNDGEVEDYRVYVARSVVRVRAVTEGSPGGPFTFTLSNVQSTAPSTTLDQITTSATGVPELSRAAHVVTTTGSPVTLTTSGMPNNWRASGTTCASATGASIAVTTTGDATTIPGTALASRTDVTCTVTFARTGPVASLIVTSGTRPVTGQFEHTATVTVTGGDSPAGHEVFFALTPSTGASTSAPMCTTDASGTCQVQIGARQPGVYSLRAMLSSGGGSLQPAMGSPAEVEFVAPDNPDPSTVTLATPGTKLAGGAEAHTVIVDLRDAYGLPWPDQADRLRVSTSVADPAGIAFGEITVPDTSRPNEYAFTVTSLRPGAVPVDVGLDTGGLTAPVGTVTAEFVLPSGPPTATLTVTPHRVVAGDNATASVVVLDTLGRPAPNVAVCFDTDLDIAPTGVTCVDTDPNGTATVSVASTHAAEYSVSAHLEDHPGAAVAGAPAAVSVAPAPIDPVRTRLTGTGVQPRPADGVARHEARVTVSDRYGNLIPRATVAFHPSGVGTVVPTTPTVTVTDDQGEAGIDITSLTVGMAQVSAEIGDPDTSPTTAVVDASGQVVSLALEFVPGGVDVAASSFAIGTDSVTADGTAVHEVRVTLRDTQGHGVDGQSGSLTAGIGHATVDTWLPAGSGVYLGAIASTRAGTFDIEVSWAGVQLGPVDPDGPTSLTYVPGPVDARSTFTVTDDPEIEVGNDAHHTLTVELTDANGNPVADLSTVTLQPSAVHTGSPTSLAAQIGPFVHLGDGVYEAPISATRAGSYVVSVVAVNTGGATVTLTPAGETVVTFVPGPMSPDSTFTVEPAAAKAGDSVSATVTLVDGYGNPLSGVTVHFSAPGVALPGGGAAITGEGTGRAVIEFVPTATGEIAVAAEAIGHGPVGTPVALTVQAGPPVQGAGLTELTATPGARPVGPSSPHTVTVTARDAYHNPIAGLPVTLRIDAGAATPAAGHALEGRTNEDGVFAVDLICLEPGTSTVTATLDSVALFGSVAVEFAVGSVDPGRSDYTVETTAATADGVDARSVTVTLRDSQGHLVDGEVANLSGALVGSGGAGSGGVSGWAPAGQGVYTGQATSTLPGLKTVQVEWAGQSIAQAGGGEGTVTFVAGPVASESTFAVTDDAGVVADGDPGHTQTITLHLTDAHHNPIEDIAPIQLSPRAVLVGSTPPIAATVGAFAASGEAGVYTAAITASVPGTYLVGVDATQGGATVSLTPLGTPTTSFVPGPPGPATTFLLDQATVRAGTAVEAIATLLDAQGNPVQPTDVHFWTVPPLTLPADGIVTSAEGTGRAAIVLTATDAITYQVHAAIGGTPLPDSPLTLTVQPGPPTYGPGLTELTGSEGTKPVDGGDYHVATVRAADEYGNPIVGAPVEFHVGAPGAAAPGHSLTGFTTADGTYTAQITASGPDTVTVTADLNGVAMPGSVALEFVSGGVSPLWSTIEVVDAGQAVVADGVGYHTLRAVLRDIYSHGVEGQEGSLDASVTPPGGLGRGSISPWRSEGGGVYTARVTSTVASTAYLEVTWAGYVITPTGSTGRLEAVFTHGPVAAGSEFTVSQADQVVANGRDTHAVGATLSDGEGNPITDMTGITIVGTAVLAGSNGEVRGTLGDFESTASPGVYRAILTATTAGTYEVSVFATQDGSQVTLSADGPASAVFVPGLPGTPSTFLVEPPTVKAGHPATATATLRDETGNPVRPTEVRFWTVPPMTLPADGIVTTAVGSARAAIDFTPTQVGPVEIHAAWGDPGQELPGSPFDVVVSPGDPVFGSGLSELTGTPGSREADGAEPHTVTLTATDAHGNPIPGLPVVFTLGGQAAPAPGDSLSGITGEDGTYAIGVVTTVDGNVTVSATLDGVAVPTTATLAFAAPTPSDDSTYELSEEPVLANDQDVHWITVTLVSASGTSITGEADALHATATGRDSLGSAFVGDFEEDSDGVYIAPVSSLSVGIKDVSVNWNDALAIKPATPGATTLTFIPGPVDLDTSGFDVTQTQDATADGAHQHTLTVWLFDECGNQIDGRTSDLTPRAVIDGTNQTATVAPLAPTGEPGYYQTQITSTLAGTFTVAVTLREDGADLDVVPDGNRLAVFVPGDPSPAQSSLEISATQFEVGDETTATVTVRDAFGNPVLDTEVYLWVDPLITDGEMYVTTGEHGTVTRTMVLDVSGTYRLHAQIGSPWADITGSPVDVVIGTPAAQVSPSHSRLSVPTASSTVYANGSDFHRAHVRLHDAEDRPVPRALATITITAPDGTTEQLATPQSDADGVAWLDFTAADPGAYRVDATVRVAGVDEPLALNGSPVTVTFAPTVSDPGSGSFAVDAEGEVIADGQGYRRVTVTLTDADGAPLTGRATSLHASAQGVVGEAMATVTDFQDGTAPGTYVANVTSTVAGAFAVTVTRDGGSGPTPIPAAGNRIATFAAGPPNAAASALELSTSHVEVDESITATVRTRDAFGNPKGGVTVTLWFEPDPDNRTVTVTTGDSGTATHTTSVSVPGTYRIHAALGTPAVDIGSSPVEVTVGEQPSAEVSPSLSELTITTADDRIVADGVSVHRAQVHLRDAEGGNVSGAIAGVSVTRPDGEVDEMTTPATGADGVSWIEFTGTKAGAYAVVAGVSVNGTAVQLSGSPAIAVMVPGPASGSASSMNLSKTTVTAGGADAAIVTVIVSDQFGNPVGAGGDLVTVETTFGVVGAVNDVGAGVYSTTLTAYGPGTAEVNFTVNGERGPNSATQTVEFTGSPSITPAILYATATAVGGTAVPGATVTVRQASGEVICETVATIVGTFLCSGLNPPQPHGAVISVRAGGGGVESDAVTARVDATPTGVDATDGSALFGDAPTGSQVTVSDPTGAELCSTTAVASMWTCQPERDVADGTTLTVTVRDAAGENPNSVTVRTDKSPAPTPTVTPSNGAAVRGEGDVGGIITVTFPGGATSRMPVWPDGTWVVMPPAGYTPADGDVLTVVQAVQFNRGQVKTSGEVTVVIDRVAPTAAALSPTDGATVRGRGEVDAEVAVARTDGSVAGWGKVAADEMWSVTLAPAAEVGEILAVTLVDPAGNTSEPAVVRVGLIAASADQTSVQVGSTTRFTVVNLQPGETVNATVRSDPISLGSTLGGLDGSAQFTWTVPSTLAAGTHTFEAVGDFSGPATVTFTVTAASVTPRDDDAAGTGGSGGGTTPTPGTGAVTTSTPLASATPSASASPTASVGPNAATPAPSTHATFAVPAPTLRPLSTTGPNPAMRIAAQWMLVAVGLGAAALLFAAVRRRKPSR
jgi:adhesin/invasin